MIAALVEELIFRAMIAAYLDERIEVELYMAINAACGLARAHRGDV